MEHGPLSEPDLTYEEWEKEMLNDFDPSLDHSDNLSWYALGNWLYSTRRNTCYYGVATVYHVCQGNYRRLNADLFPEKGKSHANPIAEIEAGCLLCGAKIPDGMKMVMLLEKL
jgi:hypothetical protein